MSLILAAALALAVNSRQASPQAWTWTLYEGDGPLVLANEVPDTTELRATLQCSPQTNVVEVTVYEDALPARQETAPTVPPPNFARLTSGAASTTSETRIARGGRLAVTLRTDHPVFATFVGNGDLTLMSGDRAQVIRVERQHLAKLRRFADRCAG